MPETALTFGSGPLVGVLSRPRHPTGLGVVMLDAGFTPHFGPNRLHVALARALAANGHAVLRFDHAGIGDSPRRRDPAGYATRVIADGRAALDALVAATNVQRCALFGMCWGADNAVRVAAVDARVQGVVAIDFYAVASVRYLLRFYARRLAAPASWSKLLRGRSAVLRRWRELAGGAMRRGRAASETGHELLPVRPPGAVRAELESLLQRGVRLGLGYAASAGSYDAYVRHFRRALTRGPGAELAEVRVFEAADHIFTPLLAQRALVDWVAAWAEAGRWS